MAEYTNYVTLADLLRPSIPNFEFTWNTLRLLETVIEDILSPPPSVSWADKEARIQHCCSILTPNLPMNTPVGNPFLDFDLPELFDLVEVNRTVLHSPPRRQGRQSRVLTWLIHSAMHGDRVGDILPVYPTSYTYAAPNGRIPTFT